MCISYTCPTIRDQSNWTWSEAASKFKCWDNNVEWILIWRCGPNFRFSPSPLSIWIGFLLFWYVGDIMQSTCCALFHLLALIFVVQLCLLPCCSYFGNSALTLTTQIFTLTNTFHFWIWAAYIVALHVSIICGNYISPKH